MSERTAEYTPRAPTDSELKELSEWNVGLGLDQDVVDTFIQDAYVAVFDQYQTDSPGYVGKLMMVVWAGSPSMFNVFVWRDGKMEEEVHDLLADRVQ
jgi:hypothetical protein